jgi:hypothetical protein
MTLILTLSNILLLKYCVYLSFFLKEIVNLQYLRLFSSVML